MMRGALLAGLGIAAVAAGLAILRPAPAPSPPPAASDRAGDACDTCTARQKDKQRLRRELDRLSASRD